VLKTGKEKVVAGLCRSSMGARGLRTNMFSWPREAHKTLCEGDRYLFNSVSLSGFVSLVGRRMNEKVVPFERLRLGIVNDNFSPKVGNKGLEMGFILISVRPKNSINPFIFGLAMTFNQQRPHVMVSKSKMLYKSSVRHWITISAFHGKGIL